MDLLTVLLHELGHAATLTHADHGDELGVMAETLGLAERRLPGAGGETIAHVAAQPIIVSLAAQGWFIDLTPTGKEKQQSSAAVGSGTTHDPADLVAVLLNGIPTEINLPSMGSEDQPSWSALTRDGGVPDLGEAIIDGDATQYFDELMGAFVDADEFRLMRFAGVSQAHLSQADKVLDLGGQQSDAGAPVTTEMSEEKETSEKLAGTIEWEARSGLLTRLAGLFSGR
jgi:hypothetical protein